MFVDSDLWVVVGRISTRDACDGDGQDGKNKGLAVWRNEGVFSELFF